MNMKKMAENDARAWWEALKLEDSIANKIERVSEYGPAFDKTLNKLRQKNMSAHVKNMNKLRDQLDRYESRRTTSGNGKAGKLLFAAGVLVVWAVAHEVGYDTVVIERVKGWWNKPSMVLRQPYLNDNTVMGDTVSDDEVNADKD